MTIRETFEQLKAQNEMALIAYQTAGHPSLEASMNMIRILSDNGADIIELGIPFSDPIADGPTIQASSQAALDNGITLTRILEAVSKLDASVPLVAMSYLNPLIAYGRERLFTDMKQAGFSGLIIPDLPIEESAGQDERHHADSWKEAASAAGIDLIFLVTPTTSEARLKQIVTATEGFIYCVSLTGITGTRMELPPSLSGFLQKIKSISTKPAAVGFGISTPDHIRGLKGLADGVIVGSRIVQSIADGEDTGKLIRSLKEACR